MFVFKLFNLKINKWPTPPIHLSIDKLYDLNKSLSVVLKFTLLYLISAIPTIGQNFSCFDMKAIELIKSVLLNMTLSLWYKHSPILSVNKNKHQILLPCWSGAIL